MFNGGDDVTISSNRCCQSAIHHVFEMSWDVGAVWEIKPESAKKVGHPAPFPVELPRRLIELYTFKDELVLDPFCGAGSACMAAKETGRHYVGYDIDRKYVKLAEKRIAELG